MRLRNFTHLGVLTLLAGPAAAEGLELSFGLQLSRQYSGNGDLVFDGDSIGATLEATYDMFLAGIEVTSLPDDPDESFETEVSLGLEMSLTETVDWSLVYSRSYLDRSGWDAHDLTFGLTADLSDLTTGGLAAIYDPDQRTVDTEIALEFAPGDHLLFGVLFGRSGADQTFYGEALVSYAFNDTIALEALYEDGQEDDAMLTLSVVLSFDMAAR